MTEKDKQRIQEYVKCFKHDLPSTDDLDDIPETEEIKEYFFAYRKEHQQAFSLLNGMLECTCGFKIRPMTNEEFEDI